MLSSIIKKRREEAFQMKKSNRIYDICVIT
jgi:hypothetical protein